MKDGNNYNMKKIQELRNALGLTQQALAEKIGVKNYIIANWEQNRTEPSIKDLVDLANFFQCSIDYLLGRENDYGQVVVFDHISKEQADLFVLYNNLTKEQKNLIIAILKEMQKIN